ncbi:MAG TPA: hypothetical protein VNK96_02095 [Fimbriimonadales bacterium]|nr:hypothetical protein [Fimbriimonadales bacterium]
MAHESNAISYERIVFFVTIDDLQEAALMYVGRELTEDELYTASKGVESGLSIGVNEVLRTAVEEAVQKD